MLLSRGKNLINKVLLSIKVIRTFKNWPFYFLTHFGVLKGKEIEYHRRDGAKLLVPGDTFGWIPMSEVWIYEAYTPAGFKIDKKDIVVDIGAYIGDFSIYAATKAIQGKVYAYEPVPANFRLLKHNMKLNNLDNLVPFNLGVFDGKGRKKIYLSDSPSASSLFGRGDSSFLVKTVGLKDVFEDNGLEKIDFLKIDCEGAEYDILLNTPQKYLDKIDKVALEYHEGEFTKHGCKDLETFFRGHNFQVTVKKIKEEENSSIGMLYAWRKKE